MSKYTEGPWFVIDDEEGPIVCAGINNGPVDIAQCTQELSCTEVNPDKTENEYYFLTQEEAKANAMLMAASPKMKKHLELILELSDRNDYETYRNAVRELANMALREIE